MAEERVTLAQAAALLGIAPNSVRSRWKAGKIRGERDNEQKIWVWVDREKAANDQGSKSINSKPSKDTSNPSIEGSKERTISALEAHVETLAQQLALANAELADLRPKAAAADRLKAENEGLSAQLAIRADQLEELRRLLAEAKTSHAAELQRLMDAPRVRGFFARLFSR
jgi:chromosome segregation ATPase